MPTPLPDGKQIVVIHSIHEPGYNMPTLQMATDHYSIGYIVSGVLSRRAFLTATMPAMWQWRRPCCFIEPSQKVMLPMNVT